MKKKNCWEVKGCGRERGGVNVSSLGVCPAALSADNDWGRPTDYDGRNDGQMGGRYCWKIAGTLCEGKVQGSFADKLDSCVRCEFFRQVKQEEGENWKA